MTALLLSLLLVIEALGVLFGTVRLEGEKHHWASVGFRAFCLVLFFVTSFLLGRL